ncbi:MAG: aspartate aminotransferase [Pelagibacterales bacterium]|nr:aspartate aminotransferase [Pelagibacterales bacterium]OUV28435.1 MAG: aspartate aminotransferase [Alphaproteobacteria bacterium TMED109]RCL81531.1 MAG: pyridoxal phosphate-dependent aminotransferase [Alphaproteobacteria bacterium]|tara:strand:+ start:743 stop:1957 length:1215 start_codon:yes stop_codon:yes gene_type:complete
MSKINSLIAERMSLIKPSPTMAVTKLAAEMKAAGKDVIGLGAGEPDFDTPDHIKNAAITAIKNGETKYTAVDGTPALKKAIVNKFSKDNNIEYNMDEIIVSVGGKQVLYNALMSSINPGDEVIIPSPYWVSYPDMVALAGGIPIIVEGKESNNFKVIPDDIKNKISDKTKWIIINSPSNPTGSSYTKSELEDLGNLLLNHENIFIMSDDIYEKIIYDDFKFYSLAEVVPALKDRILTVNGVSKAYAMTGWRIGYAGGPKELISSMAKLQSQSTSNPSSISQAAALAALEGPEEFLSERNDKFRIRRDMVVDMLNNCNGLSCLKPSGAFYVYPSCSGVIGKALTSGKVIENSIDFSSYLLESEGVAVVPGSAFGADPFFRISYATSDSILEEACKRIKKACEQLS